MADEKLVRDSIAAQCRYGDDAVAVWGNWILLWEDSELDYSGHANFIAKTPSGWHGSKYVQVAWSYGSCEGCDEWEALALSSAEIIGELTKTAAYHSRESLAKWLDMLRKEYRPDSYYAATAATYAARIAAIEKELAS